MKKAKSMGMKPSKGMKSGGFAAGPGKQLKTIATKKG